MESQTRTGLIESSQLNSVQVHSKIPEMAKRVSARILFREKLKKMCQIPQRPVISTDEEEMIEEIEIGNEAHKLQFLKLLGLTPKIIEDKKILDSHTQPIVKLERLPANFMIVSKKISKSPSPSFDNDDEMSNSDSDIDDLDLELVFCPLDFPEVYEEITKKPFPFYLPSTDSSTLTNFSSGASESGYESTTSSLESEPRIPFPLKCVPSKSFVEDSIPSKYSLPLKTPSPYDDVDDCIIIDEIFSPLPDTTTKSHKHVKLMNSQGPHRKKSKSHVKFVDVDLQAILPSFRNQDILQDSNSIETIRKKLCALHTQLSFVED